jgi:hypothetical protein
MEISSGENANSGSLNLITTLLQFLRYNATPAEQMWFADKIQLFEQTKQTKTLWTSQNLTTAGKALLVLHTSAAASQA